MGEDAQRYASCMEEIKQRISVIDESIVVSNGRVFASGVSCGVAALQLRMVYELIAFSALVANREKYESISSSFNKSWNIADITKKIEGLNSSFIPIRVDLQEDPNPDVWKRVIHQSHPIMSRGDLVKRHGQLGNLLHAENPFNRKFDQKYWSEQILIWTREVYDLLNRHVAIIDEKRRFYVTMCTVPDGRVRVSEILLDDPE